MKAELLKKQEEFRLKRISKSQTSIDSEYETHKVCLKVTGLININFLNCRVIEFFFENLSALDCSFSSDKHKSKQLSSIPLFIRIFSSKMRTVITHNVIPEHPMMTRTN